MLVNNTSEGNLMERTAVYLENGYTRDSSHIHYYSLEQRTSSMSTENEFNLNFQASDLVKTFDGRKNECLLIVRALATKMTRK